MTLRGNSALVPRTTIDFGEERFLMFVLDELARQQEQKYNDVVRLTLGKSESPPDARIVEAMLEAANDYSKASLVFPAGLPQLRRRLADEYADRHGVHLPEDRFIVSTGTSTMFRNLHHLLVGSGDEVVVPRPYYPLYVFTARLAGATVRYYDIDLETMQVDLDSLNAVLNEHTRVVVVNSPGNPLGNTLSGDAFLAIDMVVDGRAVIINDEIYANVYFDDDAFSAIGLVAEMRSPLIVTNAFSKAHRMYARRVGYAVVPDQLVEPLTVIQHHTLLTTDPVPQFGAIAALNHQDGVTELVDRYRERRNYTTNAFRSVSLVRAIHSRGGFYYTLDCGAFMTERGFATSFELAQDIMSSVRVATVPGSDFGIDHCLRLSFTATAYDEAIDRLVGYFSAAANG